MFYIFFKIDLSEILHLYSILAKIKTDKEGVKSENFGKLDMH